MPWATLIPLIVQYGLPFAEKIWQKATTGKDVTQADFDELTQISLETPQSHLAAVAQHLGLPMTDPKISVLAELIK